MAQIILGDTVLSPVTVDIAQMADWDSVSN